MIIYPAIDLIDRKCVRLEEGDFDKKTTYSQNPSEVASAFKEDGAEWIHIIDLDGAKKGSPQQLDLIVELKKQTQLKIQTGGGIRNIEEAELVLDSGIDRVIIGSLALASPKSIINLITKYGAERIVLALDVNIENEIPFIATHGWQNATDFKLYDALSQFSDFGAEHFLVTDISCDGMLLGPNITLYEMLAIAYPTLNIQASGGVSSLEDIKLLHENKSEGVIVGKALYEGVFTLNDAIKEAN